MPKPYDILSIFILSISDFLESFLFSLPCSYRNLENIFLEELVILCSIIGKI